MMTMRGNIVPGHLKQLAESLKRIGVSRTTERARYAGDVFGSQLAGHLSTPEYMWIDTKDTRTASVEIELAGLYHAPSREALNIILSMASEWGWALTRDGSLPRSGIEIKMAPSSGRFLDLQLESLAQVCRVLRASISRQCGGHVHIGAGDLTHHDWGKLTLLWACLEDALMSTVPRYRRHNTYARRVGRAYAPFWAPTVDTPEAWNAQRGMVRTLITRTRHHRNDDPSQTMRFESTMDRYRALNLASFSRHGTVEFRLWPGANNHLGFRLHTYLSRAIVTAATRLSAKDVYAVFAPGGRVEPEALATTPRAITHEKIRRLSALCAAVGDPWLYGRLATRWARNSGSSQRFDRRMAPFSSFKQAA